MNLKNLLRFFIMQNLILLTNLQNVQAFSLHGNSELIRTTPFYTTKESVTRNLESLLNKVEALLPPLAFSLLLILMLAYWSQAAFFGKEKYKTLNNFIFFFAMASLTLLLSLRWIISKHFPLSNLYESLVFLSLCFLSLKTIFLPRKKVVQKNKVLKNQVEPITEFGFCESEASKVLKNQVLQTNFFSPSYLATIPFGERDFANKSSYKSKICTCKPSAKQSKSKICTIVAEENQGFNKSNFLNQGSESFKKYMELGFENHLAVEKKADFLALGLGVILSPLSLLTFGFAFLSLPKEMQQSTALVPALQSNWLMMHVTVMILSYAALISGSILAIAFLILSYFESSDRLDKPFFLGETKLTASEGLKNLARPFKDWSFGLSPAFVEAKLPILFPPQKLQRKQPDAKQNLPPRVKPLTTKIEYSSLTVRLDNYSYRILALGFPLLTIGILSGAVWANEAWGSYWSWDPKETWALITWLVFAIYLHTRITKGWSGKKPAIVASVGFFMVWFCYLGVNLLGTGLHSYGWFTKTFTG